tara:strand:+ start:10899 stop:11681 length:783 start_codon:yes stop_codon:yes gene_type:complete
MSKIDVNTIQLDYIDVGKGAVLLFLHGLGSTKKDWDAQIPFFSKNYRTISVDLRGHGKSTIPENDFGVDFMTQDIKDLLDALHIKKATIIGFSMGGAIGFQFAYLYPNMIDKLVIVNSGPDFNNMGQIGEDLLKNRVAYLKENGLKPLAKEISFNMFPEDHQVEIRTDFEKRCRENNYHSYLNSFITLMDWGLGDKIKEIKVKTLIIASDMDYTPISFKEAYLKNMKNAALVVIKNSRHGVVIDQPEAFNKALHTFLENE